VGVEGEVFGADALGGFVVDMVRNLYCLPNGLEQRSGDVGTSEKVAF